MKSALKILFIADSELIVTGSVIQDFYETNGLHIDLHSSLEINPLSVSGYDSIILIEPYKLQNEYYQIHDVWKQYLNATYPEITLLILSFSKIDHPNHIDILDLPSDLMGKIQNAMPTKREWIISGQGRRISTRLSVLFKTHGLESILDLLSNLNQSINLLTVFSVEVNRSTTESNFHEIRKIACQDTLKAVEKIDGYFPYFKILPFYSQIKGMMNLLYEIGEILSDNTFTIQTMKHSNFEIPLKKMIADFKEIKQFIQA